MNISLDKTPFSVKGTEAPTLIKLSRKPESMNMQIRKRPQLYTCPPYSLLSQETRRKEIYWPSFAYWNTITFCIL